MPYSSVSELPAAIRDRYKAERCQRAFIHAFNGVLAETKEESRAFAAGHAAAQTCEEKGQKMDAIKFTDEGKGLVEGLAMPFDGPFKGGLDFDGEKFTKDTDFCLDWFAERPALYQHGVDTAVKTEVVGRQVEYEIRDAGVWAQVQLNRANQYAAEVERLVAGGKMWFSSGAMPHLVVVDRPAIKRWPWVELTFTPTPSNAFAKVYPVKSVDLVAHLNEIGIKPPPAVEVALKAMDEWAEQNGLGSGRFADRLTLALEEVKALVEHAEARVELRSGDGRKAGRRLSAATRAQMATFRDLLRSLDGDIAALIEEANPETTEAANKAFAAYLANEARLAGVAIE